MLLMAVLAAANRHAFLCTKELRALDAFNAVSFALRATNRTPSGALSAALLG